MSLQSLSSSSCAHTLRAVLLGCVLVLSTPSAHAQDESNAPRQPTVRNLSRAWVGYGAITMIVVLVVMISLMPSKRGHQE